jgi:aspartate racemase
MNKNSHNVIGIVGGMGPASGLFLFQRIFSLTKAETDQEHLPVLLMSLPGHIVDRTAYLEGRTDTNPAYAIAEIIEKLEGAGSGVVGIACNTAHAPRIFDVIVEQLASKGSRVKLLHMPVETCLYIRGQRRPAKRVGVMGTNGAYKAGLYAGLLQTHGLEALLPDPQFQKEVIHRIVYDPIFGIKANPNGITAEARQLMDRAIAYFSTRSADTVVLGCTELSLAAYERRGSTAPVLIDPMEVLAHALIREARLSNQDRIVPVEV